MCPVREQRQQQAKTRFTVEGVEQVAITMPRKRAAQLRFKPHPAFATPSPSHRQRRRRQKHDGCESAMPFRNRPSVVFDGRRYLRAFDSDHVALPKRAARRDEHPAVASALILWSVGIKIRRSDFNRKGQRIIWRGPMMTVVK